MAEPLFSSLIRTASLVLLLIGGVWLVALWSLNP